MNLCAYYRRQRARTEKMLSGFAGCGAAQGRRLPGLGCRGEEIEGGESGKLQKSCAKRRVHKAAAESSRGRSTNSPTSVGRPRAVDDWGSSSRNYNWNCNYNYLKPGPVSPSDHDAWVLRGGERAVIRHGRLWIRIAVQTLCAERCGPGGCAAERPWRPPNRPHTTTEATPVLTRAATVLGRAQTQSGSTPLSDRAWADDLLVLGRRRV
ncbi:uncharacterized protein V1510DRAFT_417906 [Dipodascopsis tothii]|uniref:uncharacterized protein n=1 Tax=Dipodascopsis tothii TaxID=44089 RepID=UPI0034CE4D64